MQQCLRLLQIRCIEPFCKPVVDWCQEVMGFLAFPLLLPESSEAGGSTEFPGFCLLALGDADGVLKISFGFSLVVLRLREQQLSFETVEFGFVEMLSRILDGSQRF